MGKRTLVLLLIFNCILLGAGWTMALYSYPRLPWTMPLWLNFFRQPPLEMTKSPLFFIYPLSQVLLFSVLFIAGRKASFKKKNPKIRKMRQEHVLLSLIFFNLIFIHIQRSLIFLAQGMEKGIHPYYFYSLFGIILVLIPYYRYREKILGT